MPMAPAEPLNGEPLTGDAVSGDAVTGDAEHAADLKSKAAQGGLYMLLRTAVVALLKIGGIFVITRVLGPAEYGAYVAAFAAYGYAMLLGAAGIGVFLLRFPGEVAARVWGTAYLLLLGSAIIIGGGFFLLDHRLEAMSGVAGVAPLVKIMALAVPFELLALPAMARLERGLDYRRVVIVEMASDLLYYGLAIPLALSGFGATALALGVLVSKVLRFLLAHGLTKSLPTFACDGAIVRSTIAYAGEYCAANWIWQLRMLVNPMIVGPMLGAQAVGLIGMAIGILEMISLAKTVVWRLSVALLTRFHDQPAKLRNATTQGMELLTLVIGASTLAFGWFGGLIIPLLFGDRWLPLMHIYPFIALSYLTTASFNVHSALFSVISRNRDFAIANLAHILLFAGVTYCTVRSFGIIGYGLGELATLPAYAIMHWMLVRRIGSPDYRLAAIWWGSAAIALFWPYIGLWTAVLPFAALALPASRQRLVSYYHLIRRREAGLAADATMGSAA